MPAEFDGDILDDLFHGCALAAYVELAVECGKPPDSDATRRRAYALYEQALASRKANGRASASPARPLSAVS